MIAPAGLRLDRHVLGQVARADDRVLVEVPGGPELTGRDVRGLVGGLVRRFGALGVRPADRLAVVAPNRPEVLAWWLAASVVGGITVPIAEGASEPELRRAVDLVGPAAALVDVTTSAKVASIDGLHVVPCDEIEPDVDAGRPGPSWPLARELDACAIRFSSGTTTGVPRALEVSHRSLVLTLFGEALEAGAGPDAHLVVALPLQGAGAWFSLAFLATTSRLTLLPRPAALGLGHLRRATHLVTVPEMLDRLAPGLPPDVTPLRVVTTGAPLSPDVRRAWQAAGADIVDFYGSTETEVATTCRPGEVAAGHAFFGTELRAGGTGSPERFEKRGADVYSGEWSAGAAIGPEAEPSWVATGDLAMVDEAGRVVVVGRADDVLVVRGNNVHPLEIETVLAADPAIEDVAVALVDDARGSALVAFVVAADDAERRWRERCDEHLAPYKRPARYLRTEQLPRNAFGKLERRRLAALFDGRSDR